MKKLINETDFWRVVEFINWEENKNSQRNFMLLSVYFNEEDLKELKEKSKFFQSVLSIKCRDLDIGLGDDSYWDLTAHIVGLGRKVFFDVCKNPSKILDYIEQRVENFDYCFQNNHIDIKEEHPPVKAWNVPK